MTLAVDVVEDTERAQVLLNPTRLALLARLDAPQSAVALARELDLPRQRINYHLRELETWQLIECVEERRRGSVAERLYRRTGTGYVISGAALGGVAAAPEQIQDRFSAEYLIAMGARTVSEVGHMQVQAAAAGQRLPTLSVDVEVRFASAEARNAFAEELIAAVAALVQRHHDEQAAEGRTFRFCLGAHQKPTG